MFKFLIKIFNIEILRFIITFIVNFQYTDTGITSCHYLINNLSLIFKLFKSYSITSIHLYIGP